MPVVCVPLKSHCYTFIQTCVIPHLDPGLCQKSCLQRYDPNLCFRPSPNHLALSCQSNLTTSDIYPVRSRLEHPRLKVGEVFPCCSSVTNSCPTLWDPMNCSMPGSLVLLYFPNLAQIHVQGVPLALCKELQCDFCLFVCLTASPTGWQIPCRQWRPIISVQCFSDISFLLKNFQCLSIAY